MKSDNYFMSRCIELAKEAFEQDELPYASLVVRGETIIAESMNRRNLDHDVTAHAEIVVMRELQRKEKKEDFSDCTLYSTLEPCAMCSFMIREFKFKRVVFGSFSPVMGGYTKWPILQDAQLEDLQPYYGPIPEVMGGCLEEETNRLMEMQQEKEGRK